MKKYIDFKDVLIKPEFSTISSRKEVDLNLNINSKKEILKTWKPIPIMSANMDTVTGIDMAYTLVKHNLIAVLHKYVSLNEITLLFNKIDNFNKRMKSIDKNNITENDLLFLELEHIIMAKKNFENKLKYDEYIVQTLKKMDTSKYFIDYRNVFISRGTTEIDRKKLKERIEKEPRIKSICIDVANGYRIDVLEYVRDLSKELKNDYILMVGNIATVEGVEMYAKYVDIVKAGIGQGSGCLTRIKTGIGVPQLGMILEIKKTFKNVLICSDGGCTNPGDISKAFVAGADFVMVGGMFAGHKECPVKFELQNDQKLMRFSGMAAKESQWNGVPEYGTDEGKTVYIPYKGSVLNTIYDILGGIRSTCTYINAKNINELKNGTLILSTIQENKIFS